MTQQQIQTSTVGKPGWLLRCLVGAALAAVPAAMLDARWTARGADVPLRAALFAPVWALALPIALVVGLAVGAYDALVQPAPLRSLGARLGAYRVLSPLSRSRVAAVFLLLPIVTLGGTVALAHAARASIGTGAPKDAGAVLALCAACAFAGSALVLLALVSPTRRLLAGVAGSARENPRALDPAFQFALGLCLAAFLAGLGLRQGDPSGDGPPLGILAVLTRAELDLRPVALLGVLAVGAFLGPSLFRGRASFAFAAAIVLVGVPGFLLVRAATGLDEETAGPIAQHATLGRIGLGLARKATDRDHDGASATFAGGDCNDHDPAVSPLARDLPGNGIDEDCSGADVAAVARPAAVANPGVAAAGGVGRPDALAKDLNLLILTVDTLRYDLGYAGNSRPLSPKLDEFAKDAVIFERAYALASYTGKSIPPLLIGKYPSETLRDGNHFTAFLNPNNVFLAERLKDAGFHTFGASSLWYIAPRFGMTQGFDTWDTSTQSPGHGDKDTSVTSDEVTDVAIAQLSKPENVEGRFFAWYHYMDPHAQYVAHAGSPAFQGSEGGGRERVLYDGEVWYSDQQLGRLLDFVAKQPFGARTIVVITSDHGEAFNDHGMSWHGRELWESLVRVPLVIKVPGLPPHRVPVKRGHVDLVPTVLDALGLPAPAAGELSGQSMLPDLTNQAGFAERDVYVDMPIGPYNELRRALLHGPTPSQKLIHFGGKQYRLFDLAADAAEAHDLAKDPAALAPMVEALDQLRATLVEVDVPPVKHDD